MSGTYDMCEHHCTTGELHQKSSVFSATAQYNVGLAQAHRLTKVFYTCLEWSEDTQVCSVWLICAASRRQGPDYCSGSGKGIRHLSAGGSPVVNLSLHSDSQSCPSTLLVLILELKVND